MCEKKQFKYCLSEMDDCMKKRIEELNTSGIVTLSCCCGHGKYPMTIVVRGHGFLIKSPAFEILSQTEIPRKRRLLRDILVRSC